VATGTPLRIDQTRASASSSTSKARVATTSDVRVAASADRDFLAPSVDWYVRSAGDNYREVAFSPTGVFGKGTTATVTVNGKPTFQNVQVGQLGGGLLGVVNHWAKGRFEARQ
jgi:hypothetical protein